MLPHQSSLPPIPLQANICTWAPLCFLLHIITFVLNSYATSTQHFSITALSSKASSWHQLKDLLLYGVCHIQASSEAMRFSCNRLDEHVRWTPEGGMIIYVQLWRTVLQFWAESRKDEQYYAGVFLACEIQYSLEKYRIAQSTGTLGCHSCWMWRGTGHGEIGELGAVLA